MSQHEYPEHPPHYKIYRIPEDIILQQLRHPLLADLMVTRAGYFPQAAGHHVVRETIDEYIVIYCVEGSGWLRSEGELWPIHPGELLVVFPGTAHAYGADKSTPWSIYWAHFRGGQVPHFLQLANISLHRPVTSIGERLQIIALFNQILTTLRSGYSSYHLMNVSAYLRQILSNIAFLTTYTPPARSKDLNVEQIINFMLKNIAAQCSLADFSTEACMSPSHFSRKFREKTGYSPIDYFIRLKIQRACELLETTNLKIREISRRLGYKDQYYFSRIFKKIIGISPNRYRATREVRITFPG